MEGKGCGSFLLPVFTPSPVTPLHWCPGSPPAARYTSPVKSDPCGDISGSSSAHDHTPSQVTPGHSYLPHSYPLSRHSAAVAVDVALLSPVCSPCAGALGFDEPGLTPFAPVTAGPTTPLQWQCVHAHLDKHRDGERNFLSISFTHTTAPTLGLCLLRTLSFPLSEDHDGGTLILFALFTSHAQVHNCTKGWWPSSAPSTGPAHAHRRNITVRIPLCSLTWVHLHIAPTMPSFTLFTCQPKLHTPLGLDMSHMLLVIPLMPLIL